MKSTKYNRMEKEQSGLLPSGYTLSGLMELLPAWGRHGLHRGNNEAETKKLLGGKLRNLVSSGIYISRIRK